MPSSGRTKTTIATAGVNTIQGSQSAAIPSTSSAAGICEHAAADPEDEDDPDLGREAGEGIQREWPEGVHIVGVTVEARDRPQLPDRLERDREEDHRGGTLRDHPGDEAGGRQADHLRGHRVGT